MAQPWTITDIHLGTRSTTSYIILYYTDIS